MWTESISRVGLATGLAVVGGLSLVGVLASLPGGGAGPERQAAAPAPATSAARLTPEARRPLPAEPDAKQQTPELARAIERIDAVMAAMPASAEAPAAAVTVVPTSTDSDDVILAPAGLATIAPAAGLPAGRSGDAAATVQPAPGPSPAASEQTAKVSAEAGEEARHGALPGAYIAAEIGAGAAARAGEEQTAAASEAAAAASGGPVGYVIIGSFRRQENAARQAGDHQGWQAQILSKEVAGTLQYRVAVGPFRAEDLPAARQRIIDGGIADAWPLLRRSGMVATPPRSLDILG